MGSPTTVPEEVAQEIAKMEEAARVKAATAQKGDVLGEAPLPEAGTMRRVKQSTMVRSGGVELPERVPYYRASTGDKHMLPTAQLVHYLSKRGPDGKPIFVKEKPDIVQEVYKETCPICLKRSVRKKFRDEFAYVGHMEVLHPREYRVIQARAEKAERKELTAETVAVALMGMNDEQRQAIRALLGGSNGKEETQESAHCTYCGWDGKPVRNPAASLRTHQKLRCPSRLAGSGDAK
jgi:hypothetical protein